MATSGLVKYEVGPTSQNPSLWYNGTTNTSSVLNNTRVQVTTLLDGLCGSQLWDYHLSVATHHPDVTSCFQSTILVWVPCGLIFSAFLPYLLHLRRTRRARIPHSLLNICKTILGVALTVDTVAESFIDARTVGHSPASLIAAVLLPLSMVLATVLIQLERRHGRRISNLLALYWFLTSVSSAIILHSAVLRRTYKIHAMSFATLCIHVCCVGVQLILAMLVDKPSQKCKEKPENQSPYDEASVVSRLTYWWAIGLMWTGFRTTLTNDHMWDLRDDMECRNLVKPLLSRWTSQMLKRKRSMEKSQETVPDNEVPLKSAEEGVKVAPSKGIYTPNIFLTSVRAYRLNYMIAISLKAIQQGLIFCGPKVLQLLLAFLSTPGDYAWKGYFYAFLLFLLTFLKTLVQQHYDYINRTTGIKSDTALKSLIYRKSLKLSHAARAKSTVGEIVNLMSVDSPKFFDVTHYFNMIWSAPFQIAIASYFLWSILGNAFLAGLGVIMFYIPFNAVVVKINKKLHTKHMKQKDSRMKLMSEVLNGIKVLKMYAWEKSFEKKILDIRNGELSTMWKAAWVHGVGMIFWASSSFLVSLASFGVYTKIYPDSRLDAEKIFVSLSLFDILKEPLEQLPGLINGIVQLHVSVKRIQKFLLNEELDPDAIQRLEKSENSITIEKASFGWNMNKAPLLKDINLRIKEGSLVAIVGSVGAGKSSLLSAMLGEMETFSGKVKIKGDIAYVSQLPWIQQASLKDNILFHNANKPGTYQQLIKDCTLQSDLDILPAGDATEIGEKGINLSGGQKLRVSLARAVYHEADIYIMDDPLSAVDAHVGKYIFQHVLGKKGMLKEKTRVLVTHGVSFLPEVDQIVVMIDGQLTETGSYTELVNKGGAFAEFLKNYHKDHPGEDETEATDSSARQDIKTSINGISKPPEVSNRKLPGGENDDHDMRNRSNSLVVRRLLSRTEENSKPSMPKRLLSLDTSVKRQTSIQSDGSYKSGSSLSLGRLMRLSSRTESGFLGAVLSEDYDDETVEYPEDTKEESKKEKGEKEEKGQLVDEENAESGNVKLSVYVTYFRTLGIPLAILIVLFAIGDAAFGIGRTVWLSKWSDAEMNMTGNATIPAEERTKWISVFTVFGISEGVSCALQELTGIYAGIQMGRIQHERLLRNILSCPMAFFDKTPTGRILNRFGKDIQTVDSLPRALSPLMRLMFHFVSSLIVMTFITPWSLLVMAVLSVFYFLVQRFYIRSQRQFNRLMSVNRSPIFASFSETLTGVSIIRAFRREKVFIEDSMDRLNRLNKSFIPMVVVNRWLGVYLETSASLVIFIIATFAIAKRDSLSAGTVGMAMSYALSMTWCLNWLVRMAGHVESEIVSVERVKEYCEVETEAPWEVPEHKPPPSWPEEGQVTFNDYSVRYREGLDLVLKGIQFKSAAGEKIGIVGRTGAGKSSLTLSLFRLIEAAGGSIYIDGLKIADMGLHDLRSKLTIIPQDPVLFSGTLRMNLDPFEQHSDEEIWAALRQSRLEEFVTSLPEKLQQECTEGGDNLSVGQRQLVCLARALLRKTKVLILDEATAAVDLETDEFIQSIIRTEFKDSTVLTIAHRLNTIIDYDKVIVLQTGKVKELDSPEALLKDKSSTFYSMAKDARLVD